MTRLAVIHMHLGSAAVNWYSDSASDHDILAHVSDHGKRSHTILKVEICEVITEYKNITPIENWLKTTKRLAS